MGYDLHISRRENWSEPDSGLPITRAEFDRIILGGPDPAFREDIGEGGLGEGFAVLRDPRAGESGWLQLTDGELLSKNPSPEFIRRMVAIATKLKARVIGDDDEEYGPDGTALEGDPAGENRRRAATARAGADGRPRGPLGVPLWALCLCALLVGCTILGILVMFGVI